jgi:hypothetical protein
MRRLFLGLLIALSLACAVDAQRAVVTVDRSALYGTPSTAGLTLETLPRGFEIFVFRSEGIWALVQAGDYAGWIRSDAIVLVVDRASANVPPEIGIETNLAPVVPYRTEPTRDVAGTSVLNDPARSTTTDAQAAQAPTETPTATGLCKDGTETFAETKQGACSDHGGVGTWYADDPERALPATNSGGSVQVRGYYRKDGTYVRPHTRSAPSSGRRKP